MLKCHDRKLKSGSQLSNGLEWTSSIATANLSHKPFKCSGIVLAAMTKTMVVSSLHFILRWFLCSVSLSKHSIRAPAFTSPSCRKVFSHIASLPTTPMAQLITADCDQLGLVHIKVSQSTHPLL